jgi:stress response protein SCP2
LYNKQASIISLTDSLRDSSAIYIVFYNNINCKECIVEIDSTLTQLKRENKNVKVYVITTVGVLKSYLTKSSFNKTKKKFNSYDNIFFEVVKSEGLFEKTYLANSIFQFYNIEITPCMLKSINGELTFYPYREIFPSKSYSTHWLE